MGKFDLAEQLYQDSKEREETISVSADSSSWPKPIDVLAYQGLAGEIVEAIEPHTEADPVAILIQTLIAFGNVVGGGPHWRVEADKHPLRENTVIVGDSARARKGTSGGIVTMLFKDVDAEWARDRIRSGLSSGEGLIYHVRDPGEGDDQGAGDRRLWVRESEFGGLLRIMGRDGNTLSAILRQAWDTGNLSTLTRNSPLKATGAHVSITGHITAEELRRYLSQTEMFNGFANRFIWLCVKRSKLLPRGGRIHEMDLSPLTDQIRDAVLFAQTVDEIKRDPEADEAWEEIYVMLSEGKPGMVGAVLSRADTHVMRLACLYALMDRSGVIRADHLFAALSLWEFSEASVRWIFRDHTGDEVADRILEALKASENSLTRTDLFSLFGRHKTAARIDEALRLLVAHDMVSVKREKVEGRTLEVVKAGKE